MKHNLITIPASIGEAIDKQTILEIKKCRIASGSDYILKELNLLDSKINNLLVDNSVKSDFSFHKSILRSINEEIWNLQDQFRLETCKKNLFILARQIILLNDSRFRVKRKLDAIFNSELVEQKGYQVKKAFFLGHLGLGDHLTCVPLVRYLATQFDFVTVVCFKKNLGNLQLIYKDDKTINFYPTESEEKISPRYGLCRREFQRITSGFEVFACGFHKVRSPFFSKVIGRLYELKGKLPKTFLPFYFIFSRVIKRLFRTDMMPMTFLSFYRDLNFSPFIFFSHHHIPDTIESDHIFELISSFNYTILHCSNSHGLVIEVEKIIEQLNIDINLTLLLDININLYPPDHKWHPIANHFINQSLPFYKKSLINAQNLILTDSSLFCMAISLPLKCNNFFYLTRDNKMMSYIKKFLIQSPNKAKYKFTRLDF
jgi:hypothetical protein